MRANLQRTDAPQLSTLLENVFRNGKRVPLAVLNSSQFTNVGDRHLWHGHPPTVCLNQASDAIYIVHRDRALKVSDLRREWFILLLLNGSVHITDLASIESGRPPR